MQVLNMERNTVLHSSSVDQTYYTGSFTRCAVIRQDGVPNDPVKIQAAELPPMQDQPLKMAYPSAAVRVTVSQDMPLPSSNAPIAERKGNTTIAVAELNSSTFSRSSPDSAAAKLKSTTTQPNTNKPYGAELRTPAPLPAPTKSQTNTGPASVATKKVSVQQDDPIIEADTAVIDANTGSATTQGPTTKTNTDAITAKPISSQTNAGTRKVEQSSKPPKTDPALSEPAKKQQIFPDVTMAKPQLTTTKADALTEPTLTRMSKDQDSHVSEHTTVARNPDSSIKEPIFEKTDTSTSVTESIAGQIYTDAATIETSVAHQAKAETHMISSEVGIFPTSTYMTVTEATTVVRFKRVTSKTIIVRRRTYTLMTNSPTAVTPWKERTSANQVSVHSRRKHGPAHLSKSANIPDHDVTCSDTKGFWAKEQQLSSSTEHDLQQDQDLLILHQLRTDSDTCRNLKGGAAFQRWNQALCDELDRRYRSLMETIKTGKS